MKRTETRFSRSIFPSTVVTLAVLTLSGCVADFPSAVKEVDGSLTFAFCSPTDGNAVVVEAIRADQNRYKTIWSAKFAEVLSVQSPFAFRSSEAFVESAAFPKLDGYSKIEVSIQTITAGRLISRHDAFFDVKSISSSMWLRADCSSQLTACD